MVFEPIRWILSLEERSLPLDKVDKQFEALALEDILSASINNLQTHILETKAEVTAAIYHAPIVMGTNYDSLDSSKTSSQTASSLNNP